jgi:DNA-binding winged helix-turn-helix (wHTH) protein/TolB-like protein
MSDERFFFGEFEFDARTRVLMHKGRVVRLQAQPAQLLSVLLARSGRVVSREELKQAIWGEETYVDFEKGLNFCMGQVRAALRDDAARPLYIRTLPKQGYQFIAPVQSVQGSGEDLRDKTSSPIPQIPRITRGRWIPLSGAVLGIAALALVAVLYLAGANARNDPKVAVLHFDAETNEPGAQTVANNLTDDVVVQLASRSGGHYRVIGNASILRKPREERDLGAIASSLGCRYAVLGQVKSQGDKILILAHLIRLSDLTHIEVVRIERKLDDPMAVESQAASEVASRFAAKMANHHPDNAASFPSASH